MGSPWA
jgi:hypothetical protein